MSIVRNLAGIAKGMSITFGEIFQPTQVENYPDGKGSLRGAVLEPRYRGAHVLQRDENGLEKCVACFLCAAACPSNCIYIEAAENTAEQRISSSERYAKVYNIDYMIFTTFRIGTASFWTGLVIGMSSTVSIDLMSFSG